jgi:hypothetical protein
LTHVNGDDASRVLLQPRITFTGSTAMLDVLLLALGLGLFVISVGYAYACDRL